MDRYDKMLNEKAQKKRELLGSMFFPRTPLVLIDLTLALEREEISAVIDGLCALNVTTLVIGSDKKASKVKVKGAAHYIEKAKEKLARDAADIVVTFDAELNTIWSRGAVPVAPQDGEKTLNYNPLQEKGNGFYFKNPTRWEVFAAVVRALETYQFPYDWENVVREALKKK